MSPNETILLEPFSVYWINLKILVELPMVRIRICQPNTKKKSHEKLSSKSRVRLKHINE